MVAKKKLRKITQEEFDKIASRHLSFLTGDKESRADFSYRDFTDIDIRNVDLSGANFQWADLSGITQHYYVRDSVEWLILKEANCRDVSLPNITLERAEINGIILIWADLDQKNFTPQQRKSIILTEEQLKIKEQEGTIQKQEEIIKETSEDYAQSLKKWFFGLKEQFSFEERRWLGMGWFVLFMLFCSYFLPIVITFDIVIGKKIIFYFLVIIFILAFLVIDILSTSSDQKTFLEDVLDHWAKKTIVLIIWCGIFIWVWNASSLGVPVFSYQSLLAFLPFDFICAVIVYFSLSQYTKAKNLRIEQQNKIAIIDWYMSLTAQLWIWPERRLDLFLPNISDVLFTKAIDKWQKEQNLPVDEILKIAELISKKS